MAAAAPICSYPKCTCKGFKAPKWGGNECATCFHFQEKHSVNLDAPTSTASGSSTPTASASASASSPAPTKTLTAASASLRAASPSSSTRPSSPSTTRSPNESKTGRPSVARIAPPSGSKTAETKAEPTKAAESVKTHPEPEPKKEEPKPPAVVKEEPKHVVKEEPKHEPKPAVVKEEVKKAAPPPPVESITPKQSPRAVSVSEPEPPVVAEAHRVDVEAASEEYHEEPAQVLSPSKPRPSSVPAANFAQNLPHMFPLVSKQVGMGLYGVKRIATTLKEVCAYQKGCPSVEAMIKDSENRTAVHRHAEGHDDMQMLFQFASSAILGTLGQYISKAHTNFLSKVDNEATGLMSFYTSSERIRASLIEEAKKAEAVVTNATHALTKEREVVAKQYAQLQAKKQAITKMSEEERKKKGPGEEKAFYALRQKTAEVFGAYEKQVEDTAELQVKYYNGKLPRIMTELEALEKSRLQMLNDKFLKYNKMLQEHIDEITAIRDSIQLIPSTLDPDQAMVDFVETVTARLGHATPNLFAYYDFHVTADELLTEPLDDAADAIAGQKASLKAGDAMAALSGKYGTVGGEGKSRTLGSRAKRALLSKTLKKDAFEQAHKENTTAAAPPVESAGENQLAPGTIVVGLFPYKSDAPEELQFNAGDSITVSESVGTWWRGKLNGQGADLLFPYNFVAVDDKVRCEAMFDFAPGPELENPEEYLTFKVGDIIEATSSTDAWWHGTCNGRQGYFPFAFTQLK